MKNHLSKALIALLALSAGSQLQAWMYSFTNHTDQRMIVGTRLCTAPEWVEFLSLEPHESQSFTPARASAPDKVRGGLKYSGLGGGKTGFVACEFYYIDPSRAKSLVMTPQNQNNVPWRAISITFVPSESYNLALKLAKAVGKTSEAVGKTAAQAAAASATGGASAAAQGAASLASKAAGSKEAAESGAYGLSGLLNAIGKVAARSMASNRHIDIVEDEKGQIRFISLL